MSVPVTYDGIEKTLVDTTDTAWINRSIATDNDVPVDTVYIYERDNLVDIYIASKAKFNIVAGEQYTLCNIPKPYCPQNAAVIPLAQGRQIVGNIFISNNGTAVLYANVNVPTASWLYGNTIYGKR